MNSPSLYTGANVVAVDCGTSTTKVMWRERNSAQSVRSLSFPSVVIQTPQVFALEGYTDPTAKLCRVQTQSRVFIAGPDTLNHGHAPQYPLLRHDLDIESERLTLVLAALFFAGLEHVDLVCLGTTCEEVGGTQKVDALAGQLVGLHRVGGRFITVERVQVVVSTIAAAALLTWDDRRQTRCEQSRRLFIDAGFESLRWAIVRGDGQCTLSAGRFQKLGKYSDVWSVADRINLAYPGWADLSLRTLEAALGGVVSGISQEVLQELAPILAEENAVRSQAVALLTNQIRRRPGLDIVVYGGDAERIHRLLTRDLPSRNTILLHRPGYAVARGLLKLGLSTTEMSAVSPAPAVDEDPQPAPARGRGRANRIEVLLKLARESHPELFELLHSQLPRNRAATLLRLADLQLFQRLNQPNAFASDQLPLGK